MDPARGAKKESGAPKVVPEVESEEKSLEEKTKKPERPGILDFYRKEMLRDERR
jgi:hypothetical protein